MHVRITAALLAAALVLTAAVAAARPATGPATAAAAQGRQLRQVDPYARYAPCNGGLELTCEGVPAANASAICCDRLNYVCGTRPAASAHAPAGAPFCNMCPQICTSECYGGYVCGQDPQDGCFKCLLDSSSNDSGGSGGSDASGSTPDRPSRRVRCSTVTPCTAAGTLCASGYCKRNPCLSHQCPAGRKCVLTAQHSATCVPAKKERPPRTPCKPSCRPGFKCQKRAQRWRCVQAKA